MNKLPQINRLVNPFKFNNYFSSKIHVTSQNKSESKTVEFDPNYENKNPRNLEWTGHQYKRFGWNLQYPPKDFYHQCVFRNLNSSLEAYVEHHSGKKIIHVSTDEPSIRQFLYSARDLCAAKNLAKIFADRCLQFGITQMNYFKGPSFDSSQKEQLFYKTLAECGLKLEEPEFVERPDDVPGLNYDEKDFHHNKRDLPFPPDLKKSN